jgi:ferredoxin
MSDRIYITLIDAEKCRHLIQVSLVDNLTLVDLFKRLNPELICNCSYLKGSDCHFVVLNGSEKLPAPQGQEADILRSFYHFTRFSRIACQIPIAEKLNGLIIKVCWKPCSGY